jgi:FMN phosphatase YigB (HAD superfamily)
MLYRLTFEPNLPETMTSTINLLLFDLDGTLYDRANGYMDELRSNIIQFMLVSTGGKFDAISTVEEAKIVWQPLFEK